MPLQRIARSQGAQLTRSALGLISAVSVLGSTFYSFATYGQTFEKFDGDSDPLAQSQLAKAFNPYGNRTLSDIYVAHVPLRQIDSDLVRNNNENSSALVERYVAGTIGGWAYATQRRISAWKALAADESESKQLYTKIQIDQSKFEEGTSICNELMVIEKTPTSILFRGGSPQDSDGLKKVDVLLQAIAEIDWKKEEVVFRLKCMFYCGQLQGAPPPLPEFLMPLHLLYARAMAANGVANCRK